MTASLPPAYLRQPTLHGDTVVFVSDDDLWSAGTAGGTARRLTAGLGEPATPCLSPDGQWLAFIGRDEAHGEVWCMPAQGGAARRLTWLGADTAVRGWTPEGRILLCSNHGQPFFRNWHAFTVGVQGGVPVALELGQVNHLAFGPGGRRVIGRNTADPARWKRYRGGTAGHLWIDAQGDGQFRRMTELRGNITSPLWIGDRIYFLSDFEGTGNLYSCLPDGTDLARHSDHDRYYARHASSDGRRIVYQCGAELWLFDPATDRTQPIAIDVPAARTQAARRFVPAAEHLHGAVLHPAGHSVAVEARGKLFTMPLWEGAVLQHGHAAGARQRLGQWLADGSTLVAASDASGEERIVVFDAGGERALPWDIGRATELRAAPQGTLLAIANHRNQLLLGDVAGGTLQVADSSACGRIRDLAWSPCGGWLAYAFDTSPRHTAIKLLQLATGTATLVTQPEFRDWSPSFDPAGRFLYFLSLRTFDPVYDAVQFELSFPRAARPYLVALQAGGRPPFDPQPKGLKPDGDDTPGQGAAPAEGSAPAPLQVDLDGIARRVAAFPVAEARFGQLVGVAGGKVVWTVLPIPGAHGRGGHKESPGRLEVFDFATGQVKTLMDKADAVAVAADRHTLLVREGQRLRAIAAKPREGKEADADERPSRKSGWLDLGRIRVAVEPSAEWRQMLREVWRLQRDHFWVADMSGVDWTAVWQRYAPLLERVATRGELSDLVWELQGELGTSHAYEMGGDHRKPPAVALGFLAAELQPGPQGHTITAIVQGDPWDAAADSPLNAVGVEARVGERVLAIGGQPLPPDQPAQSLLVHQAGAKVALTLADANAGAAGATREVLVTLLADETPARYRAWVEHNRAWVHAHSGGRLGYLHVPDMMSAGFAEFHRYFATECDRDGLVVDLRYNRGGHVSQLLLEKVARRRVAWNLMRWGQPEPYPDAAAAGPVVALTNEHAGSDGDIFSHNFKLMGIGTLVGTRTWGGVIGIWPRHTLVDGSTTTQPEYAFWFKDVGWGVENHGTDPDIEVDNAPQDRAAGRDRQLEVAVATALAAVAREGVARPDFGPRPQLAAPPLPPRPARPGS
ncbi:S41 family peptidase [Rubrivivax sp. RP6-9]|uniref:S41 family peptidase n=1 Tax=Rubrivivax sp. RP6-9 TaxID=3415750 RepID=UPI003CC5E2D9